MRKPRRVFFTPRKLDRTPAILDDRSREGPSISKSIRLRQNGEIPPGKLSGKNRGKSVRYQSGFDCCCDQILFVSRSFFFFLSIVSLSFLFKRDQSQLLSRRAFARSAVASGQWEFVTVFDYNKTYLFRVLDPFAHCRARCRMREIRKQKKKKKITSENRQGHVHTRAHTHTPHRHRIYSNVPTSSKQGILGLLLFTRKKRKRDRERD